MADDPDVLQGSQGELFGRLSDQAAAMARLEVRLAGAEMLQNGASPAAAFVAAAAIVGVGAFGAMLIMALLEGVNGWLAGPMDHPFVYELLHRSQSVLLDGHGIRPGREDDDWRRRTEAPPAILLVPAGGTLWDMTHASCRCREAQHHDAWGASRAHSHLRLGRTLAVYTGLAFPVGLRQFGGAPASAALSGPHRRPLPLRDRGFQDRPVRPRRHPARRRQC